MNTEVKKQLYRVAAKLLPVYWFLFRPNTFGVKVLIECGEEYLFVRHAYGNSSTWTLPGGGVKRKEEHYAAAVREVQEELGIKLTGQTLRSLGSYTSTKEYKHDHVECFKVLLMHKPPIFSDSAEIAEWKWFRKNSLPEKISTAARMSLEMKEDF